MQPILSGGILTPILGPTFTHLGFVFGTFDIFIVCGTQVASENASSGNLCHLRASFVSRLLNHQSVPNNILFVI